MLRSPAALLLAFATVLCLPSAYAGDLLPAGTELELRLSVVTGSRVSQPCDPIQATVIAPVEVANQLLVPQGATVSGVVQSVDRVGLGIRHLRSGIEYRFDTLRFPDGTTVPIKTTVAEVETAKERVNTDGEITGIYPTASLSSSVSFYVLPLLYIDPDFAVPVLGVKFIIARSPDPEIFFPIGTEIVLQLMSAVDLPNHPKWSTGVAPLSSSEMEEADHTLATVSEQRANRGPNRPSDLVNLLLLGSRESVDRAFAATGWLGAQRGSMLSLYRIYHSMVQRMGYSMAPMGRLMLNGVTADGEYQKSLDTFSKRHHVRLWTQPSEGVRLAAATEDTGYRFERMHMTHATDPDIDNERAKVVNDLVFTGCVTAGGLIDRNAAGLPADKHPSIQTDGKIAVLQIDDCRNPRRMPGVSSELSIARRGRPAQIIVALRNDLIRNNPISLGYTTLKLLKRNEALDTNRSEPSVASNSEKVDPADHYNQLRWSRPSMVDVLALSESNRP